MYKLNYGDVIAKGIGGILWSYNTYGDSQGDYIAIIEKDRQLLIYKGNYGSCEGCDWLKGNESYDYETEVYGEISLGNTKECVKDLTPFITIPKDSLPDTVQEFTSLLPANSRLWNDDDDNYYVKLEDIFKQLKHPTFDNLKYLEEHHVKNNESNNE